MATKKSASKKAAGTEVAAEKTAAKKAPAKKTAAKKTTDLQASAPEQTSTKTATESTSQPASQTARREPSHEDIRTHAYHLWEKEGKGHGKHHDHWHQAERELKS